MSESFICKHCQDTVSSWDAAPNHKCFIGKEIYMDEENMLFSNEESSTESQSISDASCSITCTSEKAKVSLAKQNAVWDKNAILALLSLYEMNLPMTTNPKKKTKIWVAISEGLQEFGIKMTSDQVRWKINALIKKYKECVDNNSKSERAHMTFEFYDQLEEILGQGKQATSLYTVASNVLSENTNKKVKDSKRQNVKSSLNQQKRQNNDNGINQPSTSAAQHKSSPVVDFKRHRPGHGTGSNLARMKMELQTQCLDYFKIATNREEEQTKRHEKLLQSKEEAISVKKTSD